MFRTVLLSIIRSSSLYTPQWYVIQELSETCRVLFQKKKDNLVYLVGFIVRSNILLRGMRILNLSEDFEVK